jgi:predicted ribosome quality control (RQC) complex YloA/Tae2 family protein
LSQSETEPALNNADAFLREAKQLQLLSLYEQRINRAIEKNMNQLRQLQTERKAARKLQMEQAMLLAQQSLIKGLPYNPVNDGFVYSTSEINREIDRTNRLNEARRIDPNTPKPKKHHLAVAA